MMYEVIWSETSITNLQRLDKSTERRIRDKVESIKETPFSFVKGLEGVHLYSLRVGGYRVILDIERKKMIILVMRIGNRKRIYDSL